MKLSVHSIIPYILPVAALLCPIQANAATTDWQDLGGGKARLVASLDPATSTVDGALEVKLKPGWSTYWRYPGSSGIPPLFDFSRSSGFVASEPVFPVPTLLGEGNLRYAGYKNSVSFPFTGRFDSETGGAISLQLLIGVCEAVCIPATAQFQIPAAKLLQSDPMAVLINREARQNLPEARQADDILVRKEMNGENEIHVTLKHKDLFNKPDLFVEGPDKWYLTPPKLISRDQQTSTFALDVSRAPDKADLLGTPLVYTLGEALRGVEFSD